MLSRHFQWAESCHKRLCFHQEFVYDVAMFAADQGFSRPNLIRSAVLAKNLFPQLDGLNMLELSSRLRDLLSELLPNLTPVQQHEFTRFLVDTCITRRRLFQAVAIARADLSIGPVHLEVQLPPTPHPLAQGTDLLQLETETQPQSEMASSLQQMEEELRCLRDGPRVTLEDVTVPVDGRLDEQSTVELVRTAVGGAEGQMMESLSHEASLLSNIQQLKLQQAGGRHSPAPQETAPGKGKTKTAKTGTRGNAK
ncbi:uncharacterized protein C8orf74 homolog [Austrofundulus limnaeus]|uniref:Uncharacterized protein C8orf74 homolog n=1 Tax=Austrofundulus limnaeus TaxID=52670 RepID=A0A2I4BEF2_AUSLI|nr:PREDICTED: uncharacterized protein C8orf74 homolog [Austrofundulus limnaeus]